jgi:hypothetical protein
VSLTMERLDSETADELGTYELIDYARERAAREKCESLVADEPGMENGPTLFGYDVLGGGRSYVAHITRTGPEGRRGSRWEGVGDTATEAYTHLAEALAAR